jgi:cellulose synthase/poly-beta-1,6-N-acetylglucosamine synthase-like glycosyltransferase
MFEMPGTVTEFGLWLALGLVAYSYGAYPLFVWTCSRLFGRRSVAPPVDNSDLPTVTLLIAAHNEERWIKARLDNALTADYPADKLDILVASDGSTDATARIVREFADRGVRLLDFQQNRGKATVLNVAVPQSRAAIIVFSDANTCFEPTAIRSLVRWLSEPEIGAVCGRLVLTDPRTGKNVDSLYWKYETFLKKCESRLGALLGANGAIYALRREDYVPIPPDTIVDDFVIPLVARLRTGRGVIYDSEAVAHEECPPEIADEFGRRARIGAGGFQSIVRLWPLLLPNQGWVSLTFFSHKVLRWLCPFLLISALVANLACLDKPWGAALLIAQVAFYVVSLAGRMISGAGIMARLFRLPAMFTSMNLALLCGFWRWVSGRQRGVWQRTVR